MNVATDHPHTDPGDGRAECGTCGKWVWPVTHSCKGVPVTAAAVERIKELIERSSLGTPDAVAMRARVSDEEARRVVARAKEIGKQPIADPAPGRDEGDPMTTNLPIPEAAVDAYLLAMPIGWSGRLDEVRAGLAAAAPHVAAQALRVVSEQISNRVRELRDSFHSGAVSIDYLNGMEDADMWIERAIASHEQAAEAATQ